MWVIVFSLKQGETVLSHQNKKGMHAVLLLRKTSVLGTMAKMNGHFFTIRLSSEQC